MNISVPSDTQAVMAAVSEVLERDPTLVLVGGSVRDILLGVSPKDYDFATALSPDEVENRVRKAGKRVYAVGKRFGTIGFKHDGNFMEVTTFRSDLYDFASRKPIVTFTTELTADLARRDFTINAMALDGAHTLIDPYGGESDIKKGIIKAVGSAEERFKEDPLRILRMVRFVARYGFVVDEPTAKAAAKQGYALSRISTERISTEMDGIIVASHAVKGLQLMADLGLLSFSVPLLAVQVGYDQNTPYHRFTLWEHSLKTMEAIEPDVELRWAALLHDIGKPFVRREKPGRSSYVHHDRVGEVLVTMIGKHLKWSNDRIAHIRQLVRDHMQEDSIFRAADNAAK